MKSKASEVDKLLAKGFSNIFNLSDPILYLDKEGNITDTKIMSEIDYMLNHWRKYGVIPKSRKS